MKREFKFRAHIKHLDLIVRVMEINFWTETIGCYLTSPEEGDFSEFKFSEIELMQATDYLDKNGMLIWEGAKLKSSSGVVYKVVFHNAGFTIKNTDSPSAVPASCNYLSVYHSILEVI